MPLLHMDYAKGCPNRGNIQAWHRRYLDIMRIYRLFQSSLPSKFSKFSRVPKKLTSEQAE